MLILDATTKSIQAVIDGAPTSTNPVYVVSWADHTTSEFTPGSSTGSTNGSTPVTVVAAPVSGTARQVKLINVFNADTVAHTIILQINDNSTIRKLIAFTVESGETVLYIDSVGWAVYDRMGNLKRGAGNAVRIGRILSTARYLGLANITTATAFTTAVAYAEYLGVASYAANSVKIQLRVVAACATITFAEIGIFKGDVVHNGNPTLSRLGVTDVAGIFNTTGLKNVTVNCSPGIQVGDPLWVVFGTQATTMNTFRGHLADDLQSGIFATLAATARPSTLASPTTWTLASATQVPAWITAFLN